MCRKIVNTSYFVAFEYQRLTKTRYLHKKFVGKTDIL